MWDLVTKKKGGGVNLRRIVTMISPLIAVRRGREKGRPLPLDMMGTKTRLRGLTRPGCVNVCHWTSTGLLITVKCNESKRKAQTL